MSRGVRNVGGWRLPLRLALRETLRRPGRTILVVLLVALPTMAMTLGSVWARTTSTSAEWEFAAQYGGADIAVIGDALADEDLDRIVPQGSDVSSFEAGTFVPIGARDDDRLVNATVVGVDGAHPDPLAGWGVDAEAMPGDGEVWASEQVLDRFDLRVGDTLELEYPDGSWAIAGSGRPGYDHDADVLVFGELPAEQFTDEALRSATLIDLPDDDAATRRGVARQIRRSAPQVFVDTVDDRQGGQSQDADGVDRLAWGWVAGALSLVALGIVISAAFASSARRQLVTVGQLSANGAPQRIIGRSLAMQGLWTGGAGAAVGVLGGVIAAIAGRSLIVTVAGRDLPSTDFAPIDLLIIGATGIVAATVAAWIPARSAARVPTLTALAGRRPVGSVPIKLVPIGLALFVLGVLLLGLAAGADAASSDAGHGRAAIGVLAGLMVMVGMCCCTPLAIDWTSRAAAAVGGAWRFAGRSLARTRSRSAAIVTAIGVTGAIALAGSTFALEGTREDPTEPSSFPADAVVVESSELDSAGRGGASERRSASVPVDLRRRLEEMFPGSRWHDRRQATFPGRLGPGSGIRRGALRLTPDSSIVVADDATMDLYDLPDVDRRALAETGALVLQDWYWDDRVIGRSTTTTVRLLAATGTIEFEAAWRDYLRATFEIDEGGERRFFGSDVVRGNDTLMITQELAERVGLDTVTEGGFLRTDRPITLHDQERLERLRSDLGGSELSATYRDAPQISDSSWFLAWEYRERDLTLIAQLAIAGVATLLVLIVVAIGLSLAATESRDERDVLVAVGARPSTMRRMAAVKAIVLTLTGVLLAVPTGLVPTWAVFRAVDLDVVIPWLQLALLLVAVPLVVGAASWLASSIAQRARPVQMSNLAVD